MTEALQGMHLCAAHQGNHSLYDAENCAICLAQRRIAELESTNSALDHLVDQRFEELADLRGQLTAEREALKQLETRMAEDLAFTEKKLRRIGELEDQLIASDEARQAAEKAVDFLDTMFSAYEDGAECYEDPDEQAEYVGKAVMLEDETFDQIVALLDSLRPSAPTRRAVVRAAAETGKEMP